MLLTLPVFVPVVQGLDLGLGPQATIVWFGIVMLIAVEVGMISPPFGLNLFVINATADGVPMGRTHVGVAGFCLSDVARPARLVAFPQVSLWLTGLS